jgi:hypothetical protein
MLFTKCFKNFLNFQIISWVEFNIHVKSHLTQQICIFCDYRLVLSSHLEIYKSFRIYIYLLFFLFPKALNNAKQSHQKGFSNKYQSHACIQRYKLSAVLSLFWNLICLMNFLKIVMSSSFLKSRMKSTIQNFKP